MINTDLHESNQMRLFKVTMELFTQKQVKKYKQLMISQTKQGRETLCRAEPAGVQAALVWLESCGQLDSEDFSAIERLLAGVMDDEALLSGEIFDPDSDFA